MRIERITSADDERLADYRDLTDVALRRVLEPEGGLYIAESSKVIGRAIVLTFRPTRSKGDALAEAEIREALKKLRDEYHDDLAKAFDLLGSLRR